MKISKKKKVKSIIPSMTITVLLFSSLTMNAQYIENKYGIQPWFKTSMLGREQGNNSMSGSNVTNQTFGNPTDGVNVTNQTFGGDTPLGSGLFTLLLASAGYAAINKQKKQKK